MNEPFRQYMLLFILSTMVSTISITISKAGITKGFREFFRYRFPWGYKLLSCPYCTSHWVSFGAVILFAPAFSNSGLLLLTQTLIPGLNFLGIAFSLVAMAAPVSWLLMKVFHLEEEQTFPKEEKGLPEIKPTPSSRSNDPIPIPDFDLKPL